MKIRIIKNNEYDLFVGKEVFIGKTGIIRFRNEFANTMKFVRNEYYSIGVDECEMPLKYLYLSKLLNGKTSDGFKLELLNNKWLIDAKYAIFELKINVPKKCKAEEFNEKKFNGIRIIL